MKVLTKRIIPFIITFCLLLSFLTVSTAAAGSSIAFSKSKLTVGENLTVTVRFSTSSGDPMYGVEGYVTYDPSVIEFVSAGTGANLLTKGKVKLVLTAEGKTNISTTLKFKAIKAGQSTISAEQLVYAGEEEEKMLKGSSAIVVVISKSTQASSNANLKSLTPSSGTLTPKFDPNVTSYSVTIPYEVSELWLSLVKADSKSTYQVDGNRFMKVGVNKRSIKITAENGKTKTYVVNITRLDQTGKVPTETEEEPLNKITEVIVDGQSMYVQEDFSTETVPTGFEVIDYAYDEKTIPALSDGTYILISLRTPDASQQGFYVVNDDGSFTKLVTLNVGGKDYNVLPTKQTPLGYTLTNDYEINGVKLPVYKSEKAELADFVTVYAKGPGGLVGFYNYDTVDQTMQRAIGLEFAGEEKEENENQEVSVSGIIDSFFGLSTNLKIVIITILAIMVLLLAAIIVLIVKIATAGKEKKTSIDDDSEYFEDDDSVGFEYISVSNPTQDSNDDQNTDEEETEENTEEE